MESYFRNEMCHCEDFSPFLREGRVLRTRKISETLTASVKMFESCKLHHPPDHDGQHHNSDDKTGDTYFCCPIRVQRPRVLRGGTTTLAMFLLFTAVFLISHMYTCGLSHRLDGLGGPIGPFLLN